MLEVMTLHFHRYLKPFLHCGSFCMGITESVRADLVIGDNITSPGPHQDNLRWIPPLVADTFFLAIQKMDYFP